jgi:hypothetical protein
VLFPYFKSYGLISLILVNTMDFFWITCVNNYFIWKKISHPFISCFCVYLKICDYKSSHSLLYSPFSLKLCTIFLGFFKTFFNWCMHRSMKHNSFLNSFLFHEKVWTITIIFYNDLKGLCAN